MLLLIIVLILLFGFGGGYWGNANYGPTQPWAGPGIGIGTVLLICLLIYLFGGFHRLGLY